MEEKKWTEDGIEYCYNPAERTLTIAPAAPGANAALPDYDEEEELPWEEYAEEIENIVLKAGITSIGEEAFCGCQELKRVTVSGSIASIGDRAFCACEELISVTIEGSVTSIGEEAFCGCQGLKRVMVSGSTAHIGDRAFSGCRNLYRVMRPDSVQSIGAAVLDNCSCISGVMGVSDGNMGESAKRIWNYYGKMAEIFGHQKDRAENDEKQGNASLWWFYLEPEEKDSLNDLMQAFLGDEEVKERLQWDAEPSGWNEAEEYLASDAAKGLNESQKEAIKVALKNPISFIQGPPGTGKTTTILQLATCMALMNKRVAIVSSNTSALDAVQENKAKFEENTGYELAKLGNQEARGEFNKLHKDEKGHPKFQTKIKPERYWAASGQIAKRWRESALKSGKFLEKYPIFTSTLHSLKCLFKDSGTLQYDYVIVDEVSQVDTVKGLIAMSCAKHLVLVGDEEQLPPVLKQEKIERAGEEWKKEGHQEIEENSVYQMNEDTSFLNMCLAVFRVKDTGEIELQEGGRTKKVKVKVFLEEHYRCHPGIIEFCRRNIYGRNPDSDKPDDYRLKIKTPPERYDEGVEMPIKILWYEGDYCERCYYTGKRETEDESNTTKRNVKQSEIFMHEEWPELLERMKSGEISDIAILSPFREQIQILSQQIENAYEKYKKEEGENAIKIDISTSLDDKGSKKKPNKEQDGDSADDRNYKGHELSVSTSTIHKSQGREFDIVYFLPAEDKNWEWPWSQKKRLVNVAVSRAKKELRVIVSTLLMSEKVQGYLLKKEDAEALEEQSRADGEGGLEEQREADDKKSGDELFVKKLVDYVYEAGERDEAKMLDDHKKGFRFHQTKLTSVFDMEKREQKGEEENFSDSQKLSDPEGIVADVLKEMPVFRENKLKLYHNVQIRDIRMPSGQRVEDCLKDAEDLSEADKEYIRAHAEFDIVVCRESGEILMAIEVDGLYHRFDKVRETLNRQQERDKQKNKLAETLFKAACYIEGNRRKKEKEEKTGFVFLRLPCDGSTALESEALWKKADEELKGEFITIDELLKGEVEKDKPAEDSYKVQTKFMLSGARELAYSQYHNFEKFMMEEPMTEEKRRSLKELSKFSYKEKADPDYSNRHVQERYLLSYFSAYACEYLHIYRKMYELFRGREFCQKQIEVTSFGCGNMVDYWGLAKAAMEIYGKREALIHYIGVDAGDWQEENLVCAREADDVQFVKEKAESYLEEREELTSDVYVFPKSLSEYNGKKKDFERIRDVFRTKKFTKDEVCILTVFRSNASDVKGQKEDDKNYCDKLKEAVEQNGFKASYDGYWGMKEGVLQEKERIEAADQPKKIWETDRCFKYASDLYGKIVKVLEKAEEEMEKAGLPRNEVRHPLINTYWCCRMMVFKRK